jgi:hypothetical protein
MMIWKLRKALKEQLRSYDNWAYDGLFHYCTDEKKTTTILGSRNREHGGL